MLYVIRQSWGRYAMAMMILLVGLSFPTPGLAQEEGQDETPEDIARENNQWAVDDLKASDGKPDEDGEIYVKAEARDWLDFKKHPTHRTFELSSDFARDITEKFYKAGAPKVWMTTIGSFEDNGTTFEITDNMVIEIGKDAEKRKAVLAVYKALADEAEEPALIDIGQDYIFITGD